MTPSAWTEEDRALLLAYEQHKATLCPGCGHPKATAWHFDNEGEFEVGTSYTCHPCTVKHDPGDGSNVQPVTYAGVIDTRDYAANPLPGHYTDFGSPDFAHPSPARTAAAPRGEETL